MARRHFGAAARARRLIQKPQAKACGYSLRLQQETRHVAAGFSLRSLRRWCGPERANPGEHPMANNLFIGPYVEFLTAGKYPDCPQDLTEEWDRLLDDHERLEWNFNRGNPPTVAVGGRSVWSWCAVPIAERNHPPRWPMFLYLEHWFNGDFFSFDLLQSASETEPGLLTMHLSAEGVPAIEKVAPQVELDWFASAYAEELHQLGRIFDQTPRLRWGVLAWQSG